MRHVQAWITAEPWNDSVDLRLVAGFDVRAHASGRDERGRIVWTQHSSGAIVPPFLTLSPEVMKAIVDAGTGTFPPTDATTAHLKDAIAVRDRLLTVVERS